MIKLESLGKVYPDGTEAVKDISLEIEEGELCVLIGPSGCGKTTTLRMVNRLIRPTSGQVYIKGKSIFDLKPADLRRDMGYAIQEVALFPHMTVAENISIVPTLKRWSSNKKRERVFELLDLMGMEPDVYKSKYPHELSGGEQQRIGVARAMGSDPPIMLMDEPFGAIDPITRSRLQDQFLVIQEKIKKTIIFITHDINVALKMGDKLVLMKKGEIIQCGTPREVLYKPNSKFVEDFMGKDRGMKWLQLTRVEELMTDDMVVAKVDEDYESVLLKLSQDEKAFILVVNGDNQLQGYVLRKDIIRTKPKRITDVIRPIREEVESKTTVLDAFFRLFSAETSFLPVVDNKYRLQGLVTSQKMNEYIQQISNSDDVGVEENHV